jgi:hypothetical protein
LLKLFYKYESDSTWEAEIGKITIRRKRWQKLHKTLTQPIAELPAMWRLRSGPWPGQEKVCKTPSQRKKARHSGIHMSSQLWWEV